MKAFITKYKYLQNISTSAKCLVKNINIFLTRIKSYKHRLHSLSDQFSKNLAGSSLVANVFNATSGLYFDS